MRKIAEHQDKEEISAEKVEELKQAENPISQPKVQLVTIEQMTNFKLDDMNAKMDYIIQWIQTQLPPQAQEQSQETPKE